jgi:Protein of unknown function (DUF3667)
MADQDVACLNCGEPAHLKFCPRCGQRTGNVHLKFSTLFMQMVDAYFNVDGTLFRTLKELFLAPGKLTQEYWAGRQVRYLRPFNLYVVSSFLFFVSFALVGASNDEPPADDVTQTRPRRKTDETGLNVKGMKVKFGDSDTPNASVTAPIMKGAPPSIESAVEQLVKANPAEQKKAQRELERAVNAMAQQMLDAGVDDQDPDEEIDPADEVETDADEMSDGKGADTAKNKRDKRSEFDVGEQAEGFFRGRMAAIQKKHPEGAQRYITESLLKLFPNAMFLLLPVFAFFLKVLYLRHQTLYSEHFIFSLHVHSFSFLLFAPTVIFDASGLRTLASLFFVGYTLLAMKRVFGQGWFKTILKTSMLFGTYAMLLTVIVLAVVIGTFAAA